MRIFLSTWRPWTNTKVSIAQRVEQARQNGAEICMKGSNSTYIYGPETWNIFKVWPYKGKSNDDLERHCKEKGVPVQLWDFPYLQWPSGSANAVNESIARWNPSDVFLDVEGPYAKNYASGTGPFLRSLGTVSVRYWLQSYRFPKYHPEIMWKKWLTYKDPNGRYIIHGLGPQAYPIGSQKFAEDFERMVDDYERLLAEVGREDMPWFPTLPTFTEHGWTPSLSAMIDGVDYLKERLGDRLVGLNFWRQDFLFKPEYAAILAYIGTLFEAPSPPEPEPEPEPEPDEQIIGRAKVTTGALNVRSGPGVVHQDLGELILNSVVPIVEEDGDWLRIGQGWIHRGYVEEL